MVNVITAIGRTKVFQWTMHTTTNETHSFYSDHPEKLVELTEVLQAMLRRHLKDVDAEDLGSAGSHKPSMVGSIPTSATNRGRDEDMDAKGR